MCCRRWTGCENAAAGRFSVYQSDLFVEIHGRICTGGVLHFTCCVVLRRIYTPRSYACAIAVARGFRDEVIRHAACSGHGRLAAGQRIDTDPTKNPGDGERMDKTHTASVRIMEARDLLGSYQGSDRCWWLADTLQATPDVSSEFEIVRCDPSAQLVSLCLGAALAIIDASPDLEPGKRAPPKRG